MINLIPIEEKRKMKSEFLFRASAVLFIVLGSAVLIGSVALLPSYFYVTVKNNLANQKLETQKNTPLPLVEAEILAKVQDLNNKLKLIENSNQVKFVVSVQVINDVISKKMPDIKITDIAYENTVAKGREIKLSGEAPSREKLLIFRQALEQDSSFKKVDLPISNFVKGSNIRFYLTLIPA